MGKAVKDDNSDNSSSHSVESNDGDGSEDTDCGSEEIVGEDVGACTTATTTSENHPKKQRQRKVLSLEKVEDFNTKIRRRGVIFIARIPPRLSPNKIKQLLSEFGVVTRIYGTEEDKTKRAQRKKRTGNGAKRYVEGWVEFECKKVAKVVAATLHQHPISNHKRNYHCDDLWNMKYLPKFQWDYLTEKVAYERRVQSQKLKLESYQATKDSNEFKRLLEKTQTMEQIQNRRRRRGDDNDKPDKKHPRFQHQPSNPEKDSTRKELLRSLV